ncbi:hypothetical protein [Campylobacter showae]|jgi:hypothetical protein|uniref:hypothetical protein n=1 Tax=Campylobacter showae TaxID=204 RepID=UPI000F084630|nr:hypothetical protein [Campylobacter showae]
MSAINPAIEVIDSVELRERTESAPAVALKKISVAPILRKLQMTAIGICLTSQNTNFPRYIGGRATNKELARHLNCALNELLIFLNGLGIAAFVSWVFERHENGSPHIHAVLFVPLALRTFMGQKLAEYLNGSAALTANPKISYLLKQLANSHKNEKPVKFDLTKVTRYSQTERDKRYRCDAIKDVQTEKELRHLGNKLMAQNYAETGKKLKSMMTKIEKYYAFRRLGKKPSYLSRSEDINLYDFVFYSTDEAEKKRTEFQKSTQKPRKKETQAARQIQIGEIDESTGEVRIFSKSPKSEMNVYLRAADGEKYHVTGRNIYVSENDVRQVVRKARKLRGKRAIRTLALVWKSEQKRKTERRTERCDDYVGFDPLNALNRDFSGILEMPKSEPPPENTALIRERYMLENALRERENLMKIYEKGSYRGAFSLQWRAFSSVEDIPAAIETIDREIELRREAIKRLEIA